MKKTTYTVQAAAALMVIRDEAKAEATQLKELMEKDMSEARAIYHARKIDLNRKNKYIDELQVIIGEEMSAKLAEDQRIKMQYHIKSIEELSEEYLGEGAGLLQVDNDEDILRNRLHQIRKNNK